MVLAYRHIPRSVSPSPVHSVDRPRIRLIATSRTSRAPGSDRVYVPSMRNGGLTSKQDRGNAILSSLPLDELSAIELPFERQRRVAIAATVAGHTRAGTPWSLRVASVHLDNLGGVRRAWVAAEYAALARREASRTC